MGDCPCFDAAKFISTRGWTIEVQRAGDSRRNRPDVRFFFECVRCETRYLLSPAQVAAA